MTTALHQMPDDLLLHRSSHVVYQHNHEEHFIFHNRYGYILGCSPDLIQFLEAFSTPLSVGDARKQFESIFSPGQVDEFLGVFREFSCLLAPDQNEDADMLERFVYLARWLLAYTHDGQTTVYATNQRGKCEAILLDAFEAALFHLVDGNKLLKDLCLEAAQEVSLALSEEEVLQRGVDFVSQMAHQDVQALKLARFPFRVFGNREDRLPPFLRSVAHFPNLDPGAPVDSLYEELRQRRGIAPLDYRDKEVREDGENTLAGLFSAPHPAIEMQTWGQRFANIFWDRGILQRDTRAILEVNAGDGRFARDFLGQFIQLLDKDGALPQDFQYTILHTNFEEMTTLKEHLTAYQLHVQHVFGEPQEFHQLSGQFDLIIANEGLSRLPVTRVYQEEAQSLDILASVPDIGELVGRHPLRFPEPPKEFFVNTGVMRFIEQANRMLKAGGVLLLTEYGELDQWPQMTAQPGKIEFSLQFAPLLAVADSLDMDKEFELLPDFLEMDLKYSTLATTPSFFVALKCLLAQYGVTLERIAYTREMFEKLLEDKMDITQIQRLVFEPIDRRCMGMSPREFKVMTAYTSVARH